MLTRCCEPCSYGMVDTHRLQGPGRGASGVAHGMADDIILATRGLGRDFRGFTAVGKVDLTVRRGTIHALIGPNGAGKTTLFNLLTRFLAPTRGTNRHQ